MKTKVSPDTKSSRAFSLVEVAISLGIVSFVLLAVAGMVGVGLDASKSAQIDTIQAATARTLLSQMATNGFDGYTAKTNFINNDGTMSSNVSGAAITAIMTPVTGNSGLRPEASADFRLVKIQFIHPAMAPTNNQITNTVYASVSR